MRELPTRAEHHGRGEIRETRADQLQLARDSVEARAACPAKRIEVPVDPVEIVEAMLDDRLGGGHHPRPKDGEQQPDGQETSDVMRQTTSRQAPHRDTVYRQAAPPP